MKKKEVVALLLVALMVATGTIMIATGAVKIKTVNNQDTLVVNVFDTLAVVNKDTLRIYRNVGEYQEFSDPFTKEVCGIYPTRTSSGRQIISNYMGEPMYEYLGLTPAGQTAVYKYKYISVDF